MPKHKATSGIRVLAGQRYVPIEMFLEEAMEQIDDVKLARRAYDILDTLLVNLERGKFKVT